MTSLLSEDEAPLHDPAADEAAAGLDQDDGEDDRVTHHALGQRDDPDPLSVFRELGIARVKVSVSRVARLVMDEEVVDGGEEQEDQSGSVEGPLCSIALSDGAAPVIGKVEPERDEDPEDSAEGSALFDVEPVSLYGSSTLSFSFSIS